MKGQESFEGDVPPPPWQLSDGAFVCVGVKFDAATIRPHIPATFEISDPATGGFYHYECKRGWGIAPYVAGLGYVDVEGYDAPDGTKAKFCFGAFFTPRGYEGFTNYLRIPGLRSGLAQVTAEGTRVRGRSGPDADSGFRCEIEVVSDAEITPVGSGINYWVWERDGLVHGMACAFTSKFLEAEPIVASLDLPSDDPISGFQPTELLWGGYIPDASFNISSPYMLGPSVRHILPGREASYLALLGELGMGAALISADDRVCFVNNAAKGVLGDGIHLRDGRLSFEDHNTRETVQQAMAVSRQGAGPGAPIVVERSHGRPLIVQVFAVDGPVNGMSGSETRLSLLLLTDLDRISDESSIESLRAMGLTPAEAKIASLVGAGHSPREAGELVGNSESTVRSALKQIYSKLSISRQSELARLVLTLEGVRH